MSPHRDDAAFSLSIAICRWLAEGHDLTLLNVFTRSLYAPYADAGDLQGDDRLEYVTDLRREEDTRYLSGLDRRVQMVDLDLEDAPIRLKCDSSVVCDMEVDANDPAIASVREAVEGWIRDHDGTSGGQAGCGLILPLGLGHHVDHRTVRDAAVPLTTQFPSAFYEDLPYAMRDGVRVDLSRFREDAATRLHETLMPSLCHGGHTRPIELKRRLVSAYRSQIDPELADSIANFSHRYHGAERIWANKAWLKMAAREQLSTRQQDLEKEPLPA